MIPAYAQSPRLLFRSPESSDAPTLVRWLNDPEVTVHIARTLPIGLEEELSWLKARAGDQRNILLLLVSRDGDLPIGCAGLREIALPDRKASFGIMIGEKDCWDRGFGSEATEVMLGIAFERLGLNRVELQVDETNPRAIRVYEKAGFRNEGVARKARFQNGRFVDVRQMAILADEWRANRSPVAGSVCQT